MKIYLSGKITGDNNYREKFLKAEKMLTKSGHDVFNPAILPDIFSYEDFMKLDLMALSFCDAIYLLPDWIESKGAKRELEEAVKLGLEVNMLTDNSGSVKYSA